jgi:O-antigen/teichoic acid export membrane protein
VGLTGVITYLYFAIASHTLSKFDYGQIAVLWSAVFITVSTLYRPIDQLLSRHISERRTRAESIREPMRVAATIQLALAAVFAVVAIAARGWLQDDLLQGNETLYWVFVSSVLGYAASYFARGYLAGNRQFGLFSLLILSESIFRTAFAVIVAVGLFSGQSVVALGIVAAPCLSLIVVPLAFARRQRAARPAAPPPETAEPGGGDAGAAPEFSLAHGTGFAAAVLLIMFSEQTFLNAGPLLVRATDGAAAAGFIFNVLMIARAPLQLFQAVSTSILPHLTGLHHSSDRGARAEFHQSVRLTVLAVAAFAGIVALAVLIAGPQLMQIAFGKKFEYDRAGLLIVTAGMGLYLAAVTVNQACLAQGQVRRASGRWIACAVFFVGWCLVPVIGDEFRRVEIGFTLTAGALLGMLYAIYLRPQERPEDVPDPGSSEELEGLVAAADEAG